MEYYINDETGAFYTGDMREGDRIATPEEVEEHIHPAPTEEEQRQKREQAYTQEVDPITCHIDRLKDEEQTPEIEQEIAELKQERSAKVEEIKQRYPYPVGE